MIRFASTLVLVLAGTAASWPAMAAVQAPGGSLSLNPASFELLLRPGTSETKQLEVTNRADKAVRVTSTRSDYWYTPNGDMVFPSPGESPRSAGRWLSPIPAQMVLAARGARDLPFTVTVPPGTTPGSYIGAYVFETDEPPTTSASGGGRGPVASVGVSFAIALTVIVHVTDAAGRLPPVTMRVTDTKVEPPTASRPLRLGLDLTNAGAVVARLTGTVMIFNSDDQVVQRLGVSELPLYPGERGMLWVAATASFDPGTYRAVAALEHRGRLVLTHDWTFSSIPDAPAAAVRRAAPAAKKRETPQKKGGSEAKTRGG